MTAPTPADLDKAAVDAMAALTVAWQANPLDPATVRDARQALIDARDARGYPSG